MPRIINKTFTYMLICLVLIVLMEVSCHAVTMDVTLGFDGEAKSGTWTPITVKLSNQGGTEIEGVLQVEQENHNKNIIPSTCVNVILPPNSIKLYHIYACLSEYGDVKVGLVRGQKVIASKKISIGRLEKNDLLIVSIGNRAARLNFLSAEKIPKGVYQKSFQKKVSSIRVGNIPVEMLLDRPAAYKGVDYLVVSSFSPDSVPQKTLEALSMWVASGGTLVVSTGPNYRIYQHEFYRELLPVEVNGVASINSVRELGYAMNIIPPAGPITVVKSLPKPNIASSVIAAEGIPIYAERNYGAGRVIFVAFDHLSPPIRNWNDQADFWKNIISAPQKRRLIQISEEDEAWSSMMASIPAPWRSYLSYLNSNEGLVEIVTQNPSIKSPSFLTIGIFLLSYLVFLVPVNYYVLKKRRRLEMGWITVPVVVSIFTIGAYAIGYTMKGGKLELVKAVVIEGSSNARYAGMQSACSIFSPARRKYKVEIDDPFSIGKIFTEEYAKLRALPKFYIEEKPRVEDLQMAMWSSEVLTAESGFDFGGVIETDLTHEEQALHGSIQNKTDFDLRECEIVFGSGSAKIGNLDRGRSMQVRLSDFSPINLTPKPSLVMPGAGYPGVYGTGINEERDLKTRLMETARIRSALAGIPILIARLDKQQRLFLISGKASEESADYCLIRLESKTGREFGFTPEMVAGYVTEEENTSDLPLGFGLSQEWPTTRNLYPGGYFISEFRPRMPKGSIVKSIKVEVTSTIAAYELSPGMYKGTPSASGTSPSAPGGKVETWMYNFKRDDWDSVKPGTVIKNTSPYIDFNDCIRVKAKLMSNPESKVTVKVSIKAKR